MRLLPPEPSPGDKITAEFVRELIRCIRERQIIKGSGYSISSNANGTVIKFGPETPKKTSAEPLPYEVRWDSTLNSGSGGWKIYLPTDHLLSYDGDDIATADIGGATVIKDANNQDTPWYLLDDISSSDDHVWLVLTIDESNGTVDAEFAAAEGQATTGEKVVNVCIAELDYNSGPPVTITIKQSVVGALHLGNGDTITPDDVSTELIPQPAQGAQPNGDEGRLQIKGFKSGTPADQNSLADYLTGGTSLPSGGILLLARGTDSDGAQLFYLPLDALWGDGSSGGLPAPEVTYLDDVTWDQSNHQLVKSWATKNLVTGVVTPVQGAPQGKTATISTTAISSIIGS